MPLRLLIIGAKIKDEAKVQSGKIKASAYNNTHSPHSFDESRFIPNNSRSEVKWIIRKQLGVKDIISP